MLSISETEVFFFLILKTSLVLQDCHEEREVETENVRMA